MSSTIPTHDDLRALLGEGPDDLALDRISATGATIDEVAEALGRFESEESGEAIQGAPGSPRVTELQVILEETMQDDDLDEQGSYEAP